MVLLVLVVVLLDSPLHSLVVELFEFQQLVHSQQFQQLVHSQQFGHLCSLSRCCSLLIHRLIWTIVPVMSNLTAYATFFSMTSFVDLCVIFSQLPLFQPSFVLGPGKILLCGGWTSG